MKIYVSVLNEAEDLYNAAFGAKRIVQQGLAIKATDENFTNIQQVYAGRSFMLSLNHLGVPALIEAGAGANGPGIKKVRSFLTMQNQLLHHPQTAKETQECLKKLKELKPYEWNGLSPSDMLHIAHAATIQMIGCRRKIGNFNLSANAAYEAAVEQVITYASMERPEEEKMLPQNMRATYARSLIADTTIEKYERYLHLAARGVACAAFDLQNRENIRALIVEPGQPPHDARIDGSNETIRRLVGGDYETYGLDYNIAMNCLRQDKCRNRPISPNRRVTEFGMVNGTFVLAGVKDGGIFCSLSDKALKHWSEVLKKPEVMPSKGIQQASMSIE